LLGGWLSAQLHLHRAQVRLMDAQHVSIRVMCRRGGQEAVFEVGRDGMGRMVSARAELPDDLDAGPAVVGSLQPIPLAGDPLSTSLAEALTHLQPDLVWQRALSAASTLGV